jgi:transposase/transcriptional regulator with XRE-family HTH domain
MPRTGRPKTELVLSDEERETLLRWSRRAKSSQALALRSRIVLACADGVDNKAVAGRLGCSAVTVGKWRARFLSDRLDGLVDEPRPGRPPTITAEQVEGVVVATLEATPKNATHWSRAKMADRSGLSKSTIGRIWKAFELKPHREDGFKLSTDPQFVEKVYDVIGLYLNPPEAAVVYCVDEKSQVQALARSQPAFPMMPGMPEKRTHDYVRHGTTSLGVPPLEAPSGGVAAFNTIDGTVISSIHRRHRAVEFKKFLAKIDTEVPDGLEVHLVCDNYSTHKAPTVTKWLDAHPRFHMHFTPTYSSWINQVERFFAYVTADLLQRSDHRSVQALESDIRNWVKNWKEDPKPFIWTKTAEQILNSLKRLLQRTTGAGH